MEPHGGNIYRTGKEYNIRKEDIIDFSSNINPLGISKMLRKEIIRNMNSLQSYPDPDYTDTRSALALYNNTGIDNVLIGNGATELIFLFARSFKPKTALILSPTFIEYSMALSRAGAKLTHYRLKEEEGFRPDIERLKKELDKGYELLVICNPNNPTGVFVKEESLRKIIEHANKKNTTVMLDESFIEFVDPSLAVVHTRLFKEYKNVFILRSLTKFFAIPGLRLGYALNFNRDFAAKIRKNMEPWTVNLFADIAGRVLFRDRDYMEKSFKLIDKEREFLFNSLRAINWLKPYEPAANFILARILGGFTSSVLKEELIRHNILIRDASNFKFLNNEFIRIAVKDRENNRFLVNKLSSFSV